MNAEKYAQELQDFGATAVLLNAAALCMVAGAGRTLAECLPLAARSIDSGAALEKLARMKHGYSA